MRNEATPASAATGVAGLDDILRGGFPTGRLLLIEGDPGVGKTTWRCSSCSRARGRASAGVYVTLSETREELRGVAASHGWSLDGIELFELTPPDAPARRRPEHAVPSLRGRAGRDDQGGGRSVRARQAAAARVRFAVGDSPARPEPAPLSPRGAGAQAVLRGPGLHRALARRPAPARRRTVTCRASRTGW